MDESANTLLSARESFRGVKFYFETAGSLRWASGYSHSMVPGGFDVTS